MTSPAKQYISFIASEWADPIADLAIAWRRRLERKTGTRDLSPYDRGMSCAIVLQLVVMLESHTLRAQWNVNPPERGGRQWTVTDYWQKSTYLDREAVLDAIVLRDVVAHNHLYWFDEPQQRSAESEHAYGGDTKFRARVVQGRLRHTGMLCIPGTLGPAEVCKVAGIVERALQWLAAVHSNIDADFHFARRGKDKTLWQVLRSTLEVACAHDSNIDGR